MKFYSATKIATIFGLAFLALNSQHQVSAYDSSELTCKDYFNDVGKDICDEKGFSGIASPFKSCGNKNGRGHCNVKKCCTNLTCDDYFSVVGPCEHSADREKPCKGYCSEKQCCGRGQNSHRENKKKNGNGRNGGNTSFGSGTNDGPKVPTITSYNSDCSNSKNCNVVLKGKKFERACTVSIFDYAWNFEAPLQVLENVDCSENKVTGIKVMKSIVNNYNQVNMVVNNVEYEDSWSDPYVVVLNSNDGGPKVPTITSYNSDCPNSEDCQIVLKGKNFEEACTVSIFDYDWNSEDPLQVIDDADCSENKVRDIKVKKSIAKNYNRVNMVVNNVEYQDSWSDPYIVYLNSNANVPTITSYNSDCPSSKDCNIVLKGKNFEEVCTVSIFDYDWDSEDPLQVIEDVDCSEDKVKGIKVDKHIVNTHNQVNMVVNNVEYQDSWSDPYVVSLL
eukprot:Awhi_evm1s13802